jgi:hypothetical protein
MISLVLLAGAAGGASAEKPSRPTKALIPRPVERPVAAHDRAVAEQLASNNRPAPSIVRRSQPVLATRDRAAIRPPASSKRPAASPAVRPAEPVLADAPQVGLAERLLAEHNRERDRTGVPRLAWNDRLAGEALAWAQKLAREGTLRHASEAENGGAGENLWMGTAGYFAPERMIGAFVNERRFYQHGNFPDVSRTGKWQDVGHYTQLVWRDTREVGCALARGSGNDVLVCRYWPAGNWMGESAY